MVTYDQIKDFFFLASAHGWTSEHPNQWTDENGHTNIQFEQEGFRFLDRYCTTPLSDMSMGSTLICYQGVVVWGMQYQGWYRKEAIPTLKAALNEAYDQKRFYGGRGPAVFKHGLYIYINHVLMESFVGFSGRERIYHSTTGEPVGVHIYAGFTFLP